jgi:serine/threonine-protein kinase
MRRIVRCLLRVVPLALGVVSRSTAAAAEPTATLAERAVGILRQYCYRCHGREFKVEGYNVLDRAVLVKDRDGDQPYITPGKLDESELWARFDEMPPKGPKPGPEEKAIIKRWIEAGAPFPPAATARDFVTDQAVIAAIRDHLRALDRADRPFFRYFTLTTLQNNPKVSSDELRLARAGVSKMLNSLSRKPVIVVPALIGPSDTVMALDIRKIGWDNARDWSRILADYPYGLKYQNQRDVKFRELAEEIDALIGPDAGLADVRADWFLDTAARPRLYYALLGIPETADALENSQNVDVLANFKANTLRRAGFTKSGVSKQMRLVERHDSDLGYYWKSYDFRKTDLAVNLFRFPLGPAFADNPFPDQAFTHAGGEIIFSLPNHLQGYMLADSKGKRLDEGPTDIVFDASDAAGNSVIVSGLSCMGCHKNGMIEFTDRVREGAAVSDLPRRKLEQLFPHKDEMDLWLKKDTARFLAALGEAIDPFLATGAEKGKTTRDFREPIVPIAKIYQADMDLAMVAAELNLKDGGTLQGLIRANPRLEKLGLADLLKEGGALNRADWGAAGKGTSTYQQVSSELDRGTPAIFYRSED